MLPSRWAGSVIFASEDPPADLDALVAQIESMPGVALAESPYGDEHFEGDIVEEVYEDAPEPVG